MFFLLGTAVAADMAWQCLSFTTAAEAVDYRDASVDGGLTDAYDTLYAMIDANCEVATCTKGYTCEEIVDCVTEGGHTVNWLYITEEEFDGGRWIFETIEVVAAKGADLGWTRAALTTEEESELYIGAYTSHETEFTYDGTWADGFPVNGTIITTEWADWKNSDSQSWSDGTCTWSRSFYENDWSWAWSVYVNGQSLQVEYVYGDHECRPTVGEAQVSLNRTYIGLAHFETWETIPDGDLDASPFGVDCDDADPTRATCMAENPHDSIDNDCDGTADDGDADGDGFVSPESAGTDCDDDEAAVFPGAPDRAGDGVDSDCNGVDPPSLPRRAWGAGPLVWTGARR